VFPCQMTISALHEVRPYAEGVIRGLDIFNVPRIEALLHVLRYVQAEQVVYEHQQPIWTKAAYHALRTHQDILRHLVYKIHCWCPTGGDIGCLTRRADIERTESAVDLFRAYSVLQEYIENTEGGFSTCTIADSVIQFDSFLTASSMTRIIADEERQMQVLERDESIDDFAQQLQAAFGKKKIEFRPNSTVEYNVTDRLFRLFYHEDTPALFPAELQVGPYTWGEFHTFWRYIKSLCELRHYVLTIACTQLGGRTTAYNSGAIFIQADEVNKMRHRVGLRHGPAKAIFQDLTYSPSVRDIIYRPLIPLTNTCYLTAPLLIYGSNHERNLLLGVDKHSVTAKALNEARERLMIEELQPLLEAKGLHVKPRLPLGTPPNEIGDIDLLVWNRDASIALAIELKWFFGPDSVYEVREHDDKFRRALETHRRCLKELDTNKVTLAKNKNLNPPFSSDTKVLGVIVSKMARPTEFVRDAEIPIVTSEEMTTCLKSGDLSTLFDELRRVPDNLLPIKGKDIYKEVRLGEYLIRFPQFALDRE
jgi:hypothetical protein